VNSKDCPKPCISTMRVSRKWVEDARPNGGLPSQTSRVCKRHKSPKQTCETTARSRVTRLLLNVADLSHSASRRTPRPGPWVGSIMADCRRTGLCRPPPSGRLHHQTPGSTPSPLPFFHPERESPSIAPQQPFSNGLLCLPDSHRSGQTDTASSRGQSRPSGHGSLGSTVLLSNLWSNVDH
jgi:hypothetical protein